MNYQGRSLKEGGTDPALLAALIVLQDEVKTLEQTVIELGRTDSFCSIEAVVPPPAETYLPSNEIRQTVQLQYFEPALYTQEYVQAGVAGVFLEYTEIGNMTRLLNDVNYPGLLVGICYTLTEDDKKLPSARFHVTGCATFDLLDFPVELTLKSSLAHANPLEEYDERQFHQRIRFGERSPQEGDAIGEYKIDTIVERELDPLLVQINFKVIVRQNFGPTSPGTFTETITGGWKPNYRNYLQVRRIQ